MKKPPDVTLSLTGDQHGQLQSFLFPSDGNEAAALLLCGRRAGQNRHRLLVQEVYEIPYELCLKRTPQRITWPTDAIAHILDRAEDQGLSVIKIHSHPGGYDNFSNVDDAGDYEILPMIRGYVEADVPHGSVIMVPDGRMFGRVLWQRSSFKFLTCISVIGPDIHFWYTDQHLTKPAEFTASHAQAFGQITTDKLQRLSIAVVGCSGTGSIVVEQLMRLRVGELVLVDGEPVEDRNLNRIINATVRDAKLQRPKVEVLAEMIERAGLGTRVHAFNSNLWDQEVVKAVAECDIVFGCMDTVGGRFLLNQLATYYTLPYFDIGVRLEAVSNGIQQGRIREVCGTVHYLQPGRSSLLSRGLFTMEQVAAESLQHDDPYAYEQQVEDGYIRGVQENRPAVISVNMYFASHAILDFLSRIHPYRDEDNGNHRVASIESSLTSFDIFCDSEAEYESCSILKGKVGLGDVVPLLHLPALAELNFS